MSSENKSNFLHQLVQRMSKSEKRYFKLHAQRHTIGEQNGYLSLFRFFDQHHEYTDSTLHQYFEGDKMLSYLPAARYYLQSILLESLYQFNTAQSADIKLRQKLEQIKILLSKDFRDKALKMLKSLKKKAQQLEKFTLCLDILDLERRLATLGYFKGYAVEDIELLSQESAQILALIANQNEYWELLARSYLLHFDRSPTDPQLLLSHPLLKSEASAKSRKALAYYYQTKAILYFIKRQTKKAQEINREFVQLLDNDEHLLNEFPRQYIAAFNNYLIDSLSLQKYDIVNAGLKRFHTLAKDKHFQKQQDIVIDIFRLTTLLQLNLYIARGDFGLANNEIKAISSKLKEYHKKIVPHNMLTIQYLLGYCCFANNRLEEALDWFNKILNYKDDTVMPVLQAYARLILLIIHWELENVGLLEYQLVNVKRYLSKRKQYGQTEKLIIETFKLLPMAMDKTSRNNLLQSKQSRLQELLTNPREATKQDLFSFQSWVDSKLKAQSFQEAYIAKLS